MAGLQTAGCSCVKAKSSCDLQNLSKSLRPSSSDRVTVYFSKNYATSFLGQKLTTSCKPSSKLVSDRILAAAVITNASLDGRNGDSSEDEMNLGVTGFPNDEFQEELANRILSGEFTVRAPKNKFSKLRRLLANLGPAGRWVAKALAISERGFMLEKSKMLPEARGDINAITGQPFFIPLYDLYRKYGGAFRLTFGPKSFVIISDPVVAKRLLKDNSKAYSKGILAEILDFVMGKGLIPADEDIWRVRRRAIVPALHRKYVTAMIKLFGLATEQLCEKLDAAAHNGEDVEMESLFSHLTLDVIGKAVFNYDFDSLSNDTGIVEAVYVALREAEARSMAIIPYWNIPIIKDLSSRQRKVADALKLINETVDKLIAVCKEMIERENVSFHDEYMNEQDPSILHFLLASGDDVSSKQLRDDLMTLLIAGHETSAAVLTWAFYLLAKNPAVTAKLQREVDSVLGDRLPTIEDMKKLKLTTRVINETLRLYPQPPVLIRRSLQEDVLGGYHIKKGEDIFISVWNLHRSPYLWEDPEEFRPERWPLDGPGPTEVTENFRYLPFGGGPRKCLGDMFATFEMITAVAMLVRRFNFELAINAPPVGMTTGATIHTTEGLNMTVTHRTKPPVIPVTTAPTLTTIDENGTLKSYQSSNGSVTVFAPDIERQEDVNCEELTK